MALTEAHVRARVETDLDSVTVQRILNSASAAVDRAAGAESQQTVNFDALGALYLPLPRRSTSIDEIRERATVKTEDATTLSADDWRKIGDYKIQRLNSGTNPANYWGAQVEVDYTPEADANIRERVILDICQMDIEFKAAELSEQGSSKEEQKDYRKRRRALLAQVKEGRSPVL